MSKQKPAIDWFVNARYGMFIHYGLYSQLGRGEWVMNRERLSQEDMRALAARFKPDRFDAGELCDLAVAGGMRYVNLTTMHHDGFRLYDSELSDFNAMHYGGRDLVAEFVKAARERGLKVCLYHTLNNWFDKPDAVDALENKDAYHEFIANTHTRIRELVTRFNPIDVLWYDGWWPFRGEGWGATALDKMVRKIQPHILLNGRHGGKGDFGTPEGHVTAPRPWRPWEACMTLNNHWGYHGGDQSWKSPADVVNLLQKVATARGNLLLNVGPRGDGSVPKATVRIIQDVGQWLSRCGECVRGTDIFTWDLEERKGHKSDWMPNGPFTARGRTLYHLVRYWPGSELVVAGLNTEVKAVWLIGGKKPKACRFTQANGKVTVTGLPKKAPDPVCTVVRFDCRKEPEIYLTGGMRVPKVHHAPYDPSPSDIGGANAPG
jgi:alpha-L-fucosidase